MIYLLITGLAEEDAGDPAIKNQEGETALKKSLILTCLCLVAVAAVAAKAEENNITARLFGVSLGMTYDEAHTIHKFLTSPVAREHRDEPGTISNRFSDDIGGIRFEIVFKYDEDSKKIKDVSASFPSSDYELIAQALTAKYGEGFKNRSIATAYTSDDMFGQTETHWLFPDCILVVRQHQYEFSELARGLHTANPANGFIGLFANYRIGKTKEDLPRNVDDLIKGL